MMTPERLQEITDFAANQSYIERNTIDLWTLAFMPVVRSMLSECLGEIERLQEIIGDQTAETDNIREYARSAKIEIERLKARTNSLTADQIRQAAHAANYAIGTNDQSYAQGWSAGIGELRDKLLVLLESKP